MGGDIWLSAQNTASEDLPLLIQEPIDWIKALHVVASRPESAELKRSFVVRKLDSGSEPKSFKILDEILKTGVVLLLLNDEDGISLSTNLSLWANSAPLREKKLIRISSVDIYALYAASDGDFGSITPENRLVSILGATLRSHARMSMEEESATVIFLPFLERWRRAMRGTRCWAILKHFASMISGTDQKVHLLISSSTKVSSDDDDDDDDGNGKYHQSLGRIVNLKILRFVDEN